MCDTHLSEYFLWVNRGLSLTAAVICLLLPAAAAHGHGGGTPRGQDESSVEEHERTHQALDRQIREAQAEWNAMSSAEQQERLREEAAEQEQMELAAGPPAEDGQWTSAPFPIATFAIHMTLMPTGKVLYWGYPPVSPDRENVGIAGIWDPAMGTGPGSVQEIAPPPIDIDGDGDLEPAPLYCSGQSLLPNGEVLITGGNKAFANTEGYDTFAGMKEAWTFNPFNESWTRQPDMQDGRWYPTQTELADGRTAILGGLDDTAPVTDINNEVEIFTPPEQRGGIGEIENVGADRQSDLYPISFLLRGGGLFTGAPASPAVYDPATESWTELPGELDFRTGASGVLLPSDPSGPTDVMIMGGTSAQPPTGIKPAYASSEILDTEDSEAGWREGPEYELSRSMANVVQLPDGSMVAVGGGAGFNDGSDPDAAGGYYYTDEAGERRQIEIFDPDAGDDGDWRLGPPQEEDRAYHSTAVLLPDGRVLSAGDDFHPSEAGGFSTTDTAEIYSPPYLFQGTRPAIQSAPAAVGYGKRFTVSATPGATSAVLMAPGAATHGFDMQQRNVELAVEGAGGGSLTLRAPAGGDVAPPGHYMLFVLNSAGVPSVAEWVVLEEQAADPVPPTPPPGKGPSVTVKLKHRAGSSPLVSALVRSDEASTVNVRVRFKSRGRKVGGRGARLFFDEAGRQTVGMKLKSTRLKKLRATITVHATDADGNASDWTRNLRVP